MPTLLLINPVLQGRVGLNVNQRSKHPPLSLAILGALTPNNWKIIVQDENFGPAPIIENVDLVALTSFTSQIGRAYELATIYKKIGKKVILGGVHAWACPDEALTFVDSIVIQEAESVWANVIADFEANALKKIYIGEPRKQFTIPNRNLLSEDYQVDSVSTSRGCPENCSFCSVHRFSGRKVRRQPVELIVQDIANVKSKEIFFVDDNFVGYDRKKVIEILDAIKGFGKRFIIQATISVGQDEELLAKLREAGCRIIFIGIETGDHDGLKLVNKRQNLKYGYDFSKIHKAGIGVLGAFMFGFDTDTPEKLKDRAKFINDCGSDLTQTTLVTPLPKTQFFDELLAADRLLYKNFPSDWHRYDFTEMVYLPKGLKYILTTMLK